MRPIDAIVGHCSATRINQDYSYEQLERDHKARGFSDVGYHIYIRKNGSITFGRPFKKSGAHVKGYNSTTLAWCYEGGLDENGKPSDTRTEAQKQAILSTLLFLKRVAPEAKLRGHRDYSPNKNGDGIISPNEYIKECPCFDVMEEYGYLSYEL